MTPITIELPWPPTANTYWRRHGSSYFISAKGIAYRRLTCVLAKEWFEHFIYDARLKVTVWAYPPDRRRRDLDNICKCLFDSLQKARVYDDDSQIDSLTIIRMPERLGKVCVTIEEIVT